MTPIDINGTGRVQTWGRAWPTPTSAPILRPRPVHQLLPPGRVAGRDQRRLRRRDDARRRSSIPSGDTGDLLLTPPVTQRSATDGPARTYLPDVTNNPFHGFEFSRCPNLTRSRPRHGGL